MNIVSFKKISKYTKRHTDSKTALESWYHEVEKLSWNSPSDIKKRFSSASFLGKNYEID
jgi:mRNA interferase HigB